jgi:hypothetical protein
VEAASFFSPVATQSPHSSSEASSFLVAAGSAFASALALDVGCMKMGTGPCFGMFASMLEEEDAEEGYLGKACMSVGVGVGKVSPGGGVKKGWSWWGG